MSFPRYVPNVDLTRFAKLIAEGVEEDWRNILATGTFVGGPEVEEFEQSLGWWTKANHAVTCANGTDALVLALRAAGVGPRHSVVMPALTFWATYEAIYQVGAQPIVIDVDPHDLHMSLAELTRVIDRWSDAYQRNGIAVLLPHLFGWAPAELAEIRSYCYAHSVPLIEDGAQAYGVRVNGHSVFSGPEFATLSFYPSKVIGGAGDGGAVICGSAERALLVRRLANHGRTAAYAHDRPGTNSRLDALQAAYLTRAIEKTKQIVSWRTKALAQYSAALHGVRGYTVHAPPDNVDGNGYLAVVTNDHKDGIELAGRMNAAGIGTSRAYPLTIVDQEGFHDKRHAAGDLANARAFCRNVVNPPLFYGITPEEVQAACDVMLDIAG